MKKPAIKCSECGVVCENVSGLFWHCFHEHIGHNDSNYQEWDEGTKQIANFRQTSKLDRQFRLDNAFVMAGESLGNFKHRTLKKVYRENAK